jgi:uncharacterized protein with HEPN domain
MRDYARKAVPMAANQQRDDLDRDEKLRFALTHLVELVGEAASRVPPEVQRLHPEIPWPQVVNMRHRLIHGYDFVDHDILWDTIVVDLPPLIATLEKVVGKDIDIRNAS